MNKLQIITGLMVISLTISTVYVFNHTSFSFDENNKQEQSFIKLNENDNDLNLPLLWEQYQKQFRFHFDDSEEEEKYRYSVFIKNIQIIQSNSQLSMTQYMHLTQEEFAEQTFGVVESPVNHFQSYQTVTLPINNIDWQTKQAVSPVKNQGMCASSWAFSVVAGVESSLYLKSKNNNNNSTQPAIPDLSEQFFLDCDKQNNGCDGGDREKALEYVIDNGLNTQQVNFYRAYSSKCKYTTKQPYSIQSYKTFENSCQDILTALQDGPVIVAIDGTLLQFYSKGILNVDYQQTNFAGLLVGYNQEQGYWKIKTSLSTKFGESGYLRLYGGINNQSQIKNTAGICNKAFQVIA